MVFHWRLSDSKSPQVSGTLLTILAVMNNAVVWMVSTRPPTSKSSRPFNNPLVTVPKAPITNGIIVTFMFHSFFNSLARSRYLSVFSHYYYFTPCKFFTPALTSGISPGPDGQPISSSLQDSSQYSGGCQQCCSLNGLESSSDFLLFQFPFQSFADPTSAPTTIAIIVTRMFHSFVSSLAIFYKYLSLLLLIFYCHHFRYLQLATFLSLLIFFKLVFTSIFHAR